MKMRNDLGDIKILLQSNVRALVKVLAPDGSVAGRYWMAKNPTREDKNSGSFWILLTGNAPGIWRDEATGDKGDIISLIQYIFGFSGVAETLEWSRGWLGLAEITSVDLKKARDKMQGRAIEEDARADREKDKYAKAALGWWLDCKPDLTDTLAARYLKTRGIDLAKLERPPRVLRYSPKINHRPSGSFWPAIMAIMTNADDKNIAVHRTFLAHDGLAKAPVSPPRMIWPSFKGAAIRLTRGAGNYRPSDAIKKGEQCPLVLTEGVEDGLSVALAYPDYRIWSAGSLGNLQSIKIPECASQVIVCADNDWGKPQAEKLLMRGVDALVAQGALVKIARSAVGKDMNDALCA